MNKLFTVIVLLFAISVTLIADPGYYNYNNGTSYNSFPLNQAAGKRIQTYIAPGEFNQPGPAPNGNITKFSVRISTPYPLGPVTYTNFRIIFIDSTLSGNTMAPGWYLHPNADTVFFRASLGPISAAGGTWLDFTLDHPHPYNNTKGLVVAIEQTAASGTFSGFSLQHTTTPTYRRHYSVGGAPFVYSNRSLYVPNCGIDVAPPTTPPGYLQYKFEQNPSSSMTWNCASPGVGTNPSTISGSTSLTSGGQFDSCLMGTGGTNAGVVTGWNCNLGTSSWTISMWLSIPTTSSGSAFYIFGDPGSQSFRCFHNGVAGVNNLVLRKTGMTDVPVTGIGPAPTVVTFVFDSAMSQIRAYKNGVLANTVAQTSFNIQTGTGFKVGGYSTSATYVGKLDEFRLYRRALPPAEIMATWNMDLNCGIVLGINQSNSQIPNTFRLDQNYPNPFNPVTTISFGIPKASNVKVTIYDLLGREVEVLVNEFVKAGNHTVDFNATNLASGMYLYKLEAEGFVNTRKMILVK